MTQLLCDMQSVAWGTASAPRLLQTDKTPSPRALPGKDTQAEVYKGACPQDQPELQGSPPDCAVQFKLNDSELQGESGFLSGVSRGCSAYQLVCNVAGATTRTGARRALSPLQFGGLAALSDNEDWNSESSLVTRKQPSQ